MWIDKEGFEHEDGCPGFRGFFEWPKVGNDTPHEDIIELVWALQESMGVKVIFVSGREDVCYDETLEWLQTHYWLGIDTANTAEEIVLFMRKAGDKRKDSIVKLEIFDEHIRDHYNVKFCLDDRNQVVDAYRSIGLRVLQVAPGNF